MEANDFMKKLGFTEYETKAYLSLLRENPVTGYAVAKNSGVPRSKIYEVLDGLKNRGDIIVSEGDPPLYRPLAAKELIAGRRSEAERHFAAAERSLIELEKDTGDRENIWNIRGRDAILQKVETCIAEAGERILIEIWAEDFAPLDRGLREAAERGVKIYIISYGDILAEYASVYPHDGSDRITEEYGGRWVVFSADDSQVVAGTLSFGDDNRAAWTKHPGLVMPITEVIIHDLYIAEIMRVYGPEIEKTFGRNLQRLRDRFQMKADFMRLHKERI